jgi:flagellar assembly protein FliH
MPVVTKMAAASMLKGAIVLDLGDLTRQGERIVAAAQAKADQIVAQSQQQAEKDVVAIRERVLAEARSQGLAQGLEEGREEGHAEALAEARQKLREVEQRWAEVAGQWEAARDAMERQCRQSVLELGLALGEKLVQRIIEVDPTVIVDQLGAALEHVLKPLEVTVQIHADDRPVLEEALPGLLGRFSHLKGIHLKDEPSVGRGGCQLRFGQGSIDATVQTQLRRIVELLLPAEPPEPPESPESPEKESLGKVATAQPEAQAGDLVADEGGAEGESGGKLPQA